MEEQGYAVDIAQAHGGAIEVSSKIGAGTVFTVWLATS
jgi:signal transduction histidine kinase